VPVQGSLRVLRSSKFFVRVEHADRRTELAHILDGFK
jgi:hypothetical protein